MNRNIKRIHHKSYAIAISDKAAAVDIHPTDRTKELAVIANAYVKECHPSLIVAAFSADCGN